MDDQPKPKRPDLVSEIFGTRGELVRIVRTFRQVLVNVRPVMENWEQGGKDYSSPVKYTFSMAAFMVLAIQLLGLDLFEFFMNSMSKASGQEIDPAAIPDPEMAAFMTEHLNTTNQLNSIQNEFLPVYYLLFVIPAASIWMKVLFSKKGIGFGGYYALTGYLMMTAAFFSNILVLIGYAFDLSLWIWGYGASGITYLIFIVGCIKYFELNKLKAAGLAIATIFLYTFTLMIVVTALAMTVTIIRLQ